MPLIPGSPQDALFQRLAGGAGGPDAGPPGPPPGGPPPDLSALMGGGPPPDMGAGPPGPPMDTGNGGGDLSKTDVVQSIVQDIHQAMQIFTDPQHVSMLGKMLNDATTLQKDVMTGPGGGP